MEPLPSPSPSPLDPAQEARLEEFAEAWWDRPADSPPPRWEDYFPAEQPCPPALVFWLQAAEQERAAEAARAAEELQAAGRKLEEEARARAWAEQRARRRTAALVSVATVAVLAASAAVGWYWLEQAGRRARAQSEVEAVLQEARAHLEQELDLERNDPERWAATLDLAESLVERAEAIAAAGQVNAEVRDRVRVLREQVAPRKRDSHLRVELDRIRLEKTAVKEGRYNFTAALPRYRAVLAGYGIDLDDPEQAGAVVRSSRLRQELLSALEDCTRVAKDPAEQQRMRAVLEAAGPDQDGFRTRWRQAVLRSDAVALVTLAQQASHLPATDVVNLAADLVLLQDIQAAERLLRAAQQRFPGDFWINHDLGILLLQQVPPKSEDAVRYLTAAAALRSQSPGAIMDLGYGLLSLGRAEEAAAAFRQAINLDPKSAPAHTNLAIVLRSQGQVEEAISEYRKAIALDPRFATAHNGLGGALHEQGKTAEAIAAFRQAIALDPKLPDAHSNLGLALARRREWDAAIRSYRQAIELNPRYGIAHANLGDALLQLGDFEGAHKAIRRSLELLPAEHPLRLTLPRVLRECEAGQALDAKLPAILRGDTQPASTAETLTFARFCQRYKQLHAASVRLYGDAFRADPKLAADMDAQHRYNAACSAALAAAGQGKDADKLDSKERQRLRLQALEWLRADLDAWGKRLAGAAEKDKEAVRKVLEHWQQDTDLASLRDDKALAALPAEERDRWQQLWADVGALLDKAAAPR
jgi:tetratricopeptide (TPR) repeat protein